MPVFLGVFAAAGAVILIIHIGLAVGVCAALLRDARRPHSARSGARPRAEVIIAVRNEEANIESLLKSLAAQDEPGCAFLFVDDDSSDRTPEILEGFCASMDGRARFLLRKGDPGLLTRKQAALELAFSHCRGEILLFTDGDCVVGPGWVRSMVDGFADPGVDVVLGRIELETDGSFLSRFQAFEQPLINQYNLGSASMGLPTGCFGNDMAARAQAIRSVGGFTRIGYSVTEDAALLAALSRRPGARVRVATGAEAAVITRPKKSWKEYLNQHVRWNSGAFFSRDITTRLSYSFIVLYLIFCMAALPFGFLDWRISILGLNAFLSMGFLGFAGGLYPGKRAGFYYARLLPYVFFFGFFYSFVSLKALLKRPFEWKGAEMGIRPQKG
jgi:poly-beta-1,6-N-acetyl-D-glucosamine synthase